MFHSASSFNGDLSAWNVANVTDMRGMFNGASAFNGDLSAWNVANVTDMMWMFWGASAFNGDLSAWNVAKVTNMSYMFAGASSFNGDLSAWTVANVTGLWGMFCGASSFNGDLSAWNVANVTDMGGMFSGSGIRAGVSWCEKSFEVASRNHWSSRRGLIARWNWARVCHCDAALCKDAAQYCRPLELGTRLRAGKYAGGIQLAGGGLRLASESVGVGEIRAVIGAVGHSD